MKSRFLILTAMALLAGCAQAEQATPELSPETAIPTAAPTDTALPPEPTATDESEPIAIPTATETPTEPSLSLPTEAEIIAAVLASGEPAVLQSLPSPDGLWLAEVWQYECVDVLPVQQYAYEVLRLTGPDGEHEVTHQLIGCGGLGAYGLNILAWSEDSRNFYFDEARGGVPDGPGCGNWSHGTTRIDVAVLESVRLPGDGPLLPGGSAFLIWGGPDWILWDLAEGEVARSESVVTEVPVVSMALSEDGGRAVYIQRSDCISPDEDATVVLLDLATMAHTVLLESEDPGFVSAYWETVDVVILVDPTGAEYTFTISTGTLSPPDY